MADPFFIIGNPRSGTSLYRLMLNFHSEVVVPPECGYIQWLYHKFGSLISWDDSDYCAIAKDIYESRRFGSWGIAQSQIYEHLLKVRPENYADVCASVHQMYASQSSKMVKFWGDKNNYYVQHLDLLKSIYPEAKYLFIYRDPRDVFCSYRDLHINPVKSEFAPKLTGRVSEFCEEWNTNFRLMNTFRTVQDTLESVYLIRYEDLIRDARGALEGVFRFLRLKMEESVLSYYQAPSSEFKEPEISLAWKKKTRQAPDLSNVGKFKTLLASDEVELIESKCLEGMQMLKYL